MIPPDQQTNETVYGIGMSRTSSTMENVHAVEAYVLS